MLSFSGLPLPRSDRSGAASAHAAVESWQPPFGRARDDFGCGDHERVGPSTTEWIECVRAAGQWEMQWIEDTEIGQPDAPPAHLLRVCESHPDMDLPCRFALVRSFTPGFLRNPKRFPETQSVSPLAPLTVRHDVVRGVWEVVEGKTATTADADDWRPTWLFDHRLAPIERAVLALDTFPSTHVLPWWWGAVLLASAVVGCVLLFICLRRRPGQRTLSLPYLGLLALVAALPLPLVVASAVNAATWPLLATKAPTEGSAVATRANECDAPMRITGTQTATSADSFCLDPHPVTRAAYEACVRRGACPQAITSARVGDHECIVDADTTPSSPMSCLDRTSAEAYCETRGARLLRSTELSSAHDLEEPELSLGFCNFGSCWSPKTPDTKEFTEDVTTSLVEPAPHTYFRCAK
jgi:hypothetical protein